MVILGVPNVLKHADRYLRDNLPALRRIRRHIHRNPECKYEEFATAELVERELSSCGVPHKRVGKTGVVGLIKGVARGKTIALRADMDALRMPELTGLPYASVNDCMHACGHDGHTAILIGAAKILSQLRDKFAGNVKLIFQPAEEGGAGAKQLCDLGVLTAPKVSAVFGLHGFNANRVGTIGVMDGPMTACAEQFYVMVTGRGAHGAYPHKSVDPILISARIVEALQSIVAREVDPLSPAVVTVGTIHGGTGENIIPKSVRMSGTLRSYDPDVRVQLADAVKRIVRKTAVAAGGKATVRIPEGYPATINDKASVDVIRRAGAAALGADNVVELTTPTMGAEDFSFYLQHVPGAFFRLGTGDGTGKQAPAHNPYFDFNDKAIAHGVKMFVSIVRDVLGR